MGLLPGGTCELNRQSKPERKEGLQAAASAEDV
jgi:hypothetical protein